MPQIVSGFTVPAGSDAISTIDDTMATMAGEISTALTAKANTASPSFTGQSTITHTVPAYILTESDASNSTTQFYQNSGLAVIRVDSTGVTAGSTFNVMIDATTRMTIDENGLITGSGSSLGAGVTYTPTISGTGWALGNGTLAANYVRVGNLVTVFVAIQFGSTSTYGTGALQISLPSTATRESNILGHGVDLSASNSYQLMGRIGADSLSTATVNVISSAAGLIQTVINTRPITWATSDTIYLSGTYQQ